MQPDPLFIDDGFTRTHDIAAAPGLHPAVRVVFRPALERERKLYDQKLALRDPAELERHENDLICKYVVELNGKPPSEWRAKLDRLHPTVRAAVLNLVFSYTPAKQAEDEGKSSGA
jgi:hypothetical protein